MQVITKITPHMSFKYGVKETVYFALETVSTIMFCSLRTKASTCVSITLFVSGKEFVMYPENNTFLATQARLFEECFANSSAFESIIYAHLFMVELNLMLDSYCNDGLLTLS